MSNRPLPDLRRKLRPLAKRKGICPVCQRHVVRTQRDPGPVCRPCWTRGKRGPRTRELFALLERSLEFYRGGAKTKWRTSQAQKAAVVDCSTYCNVSPSTVKGWRCGNRTPKIEQVLALREWVMSAAAMAFAAQSTTLTPEQTGWGYPNRPKTQPAP